MKICHVTSVHKLNDIRIYLKECRSLAKKYDVTLLCNDTQNSLLEDSNINIVNLNFVVSNRIERFYKLNLMLYKEALKINADIYHLHDPELLVLAHLLKRKGKKVIFDSHEETAKQILSKTYIPLKLRKIISKLYRGFEIFTVKKIDGVIAATPTIKLSFIRHNNLVTDVNNYPILDEFQSISSSFENKKNQIIYIGGLSNERGLLTMIEIANRMPNIKLVLCGNFVSKNEEKIAMNNIINKNIQYLGYLNRDQIKEVLQDSKIGLVLLERNPRYINSLPIKMFEYMAANIPMVVSNFKLWETIINESNAGICVDERNINEIVDAISTLISSDNLMKKLGDSGRKYVNEKYNWENEEVKLFDIYEKVEKL